MVGACRDEDCGRFLTVSELAHQWFGNLVTMDWWNELWLNEGFATWVGWYAIDYLYPGMKLIVRDVLLFTDNNLS
jgi:aminopeptidase N